MQLLDLANAWCGPSPRLDRLRQSTAGAPHRPARPASNDPVTLSTLDHYDQGRAYLRAGRFREAAVDFQRVLDQRPQDFWPNFYQGLCAYRLGQFHDALAAFRTCIALAPDSAECYYNRARVAEALGRSDQAMHDYSRALELDPALTVGIDQPRDPRLQERQKRRRDRRLPPGHPRGLRFADAGPDPLQPGPGPPGARRPRKRRWPAPGGHGPRARRCP